MSPEVPLSCACYQPIALSKTPAPCRIVTQLSGPEDKQLLTHARVEDANNILEISNRHSAWRQTFGDMQLRHAAFTVRCRQEAHTLSGVTFAGDMCSANLQVAPLWFGAQLAFNFSLSMTNVTSNTILSSTSGLFTYGLSCLLLGEAYTLLKLLSILVCITGVPLCPALLMLAHHLHPCQVLFCTNS